MICMACYCISPITVVRVAILMREVSTLKNEKYELEESLASVQGKM